MVSSELPLPSLRQDPMGIKHATKNQRRHPGRHGGRIIPRRRPPPTHDHGDYRVPRGDLLSATKALLQAGRLKFAELPETPTLVEEFLSFPMKTNPGRHKNSSPSTKSPPVAGGLFVTCR